MAEEALQGLGAPTEIPHRHGGAILIEMGDTSAEPVAMVADAHELFRAGAAAMLVRECGFATVLEAASFSEALDLLDRHPSVSLACFDLALPGIARPLDLRRVRERFPEVRVAVVTGFDSRENILLVLESGLHGFVPKTLPTPEIIKALRTVISGDVYVPQSLAALPAADAPATFRPLTGEGSEAEANGVAPSQDLTRRQQEILGLIRHGRSNREIGRRLGLSENTVKVHTSALFKKLRVHSRFQAAAMKWSGRSERRDDDGVDRGRSLPDHTAKKP